MNVNKLSMSDAGVGVGVLKYLEFIWKSLLRVFPYRKMSRFFSQFSKCFFGVVFSF